MCHLGCGVGVVILSLRGAKTVVICAEVILYYSELRHYPPESVGSNAMHIIKDKSRVWRGRRGLWDR